MGTTTDLASVPEKKKRERTARFRMKISASRARYQLREGTLIPVKRKEGESELIRRMVRQRRSGDAWRCIAADAHCIMHDRRVKYEEHKETGCTLKAHGGRMRLRPAATSRETNNAT